MKQIAFLCLALVMALGSLGVAYAAWTDTLTIDGTVDTGTVEIDIVGYSETHVYKVLPHDIAVVRTFLDLNDVVLWHSIDGAEWVAGPPETAGWLLIASATVVSIDQYADSADVDYYNLFPCVEVGVDLLVHYNGSIPGRINSIEFTGESTGSSELDELLKAGTGYAWGEMHRAVGDPRAGDPPIRGDVVELGTQLHQCDLVLVDLFIHLSQVQCLQDETGTVTYTVEVVQWDEYPYN